MSRDIGETTRRYQGAQVMTEAAIFTCSICGEPSGEICVYCTKDTCANHRCERCKRCSDCCECEIPLSAAEAPAAAEVEAPPEPPPAGYQDQTPEESQPAEYQDQMRRESQAAESQDHVAPPPQPAGESESEHALEPVEDIQPPHPENPIF